MASQDPPSTTAELGRQLQHVLARARDAWPNLAMDSNGFLAYLKERVPEPAPHGDAPESMEEQLARTSVEDLFLAYCCSQGDDVALLELHKQYAPEVARIARRFATTLLPVEDLQQRLWERLTVGTGDLGPRIAQYQGAGRLTSWLRVTAVRTFLNERRAMRRAEQEIPLEDFDLFTLERDTDPELATMKTRYRQDFKQAFGQAIGALSVQQRDLLRLHVVERLSIVQIGALYQVHHATIARRLLKARKTLLSSTRRELMQRLGVNHQELDSIIRLIESQLEVSLRRLLTHQGSAPDALPKEESVDDLGAVRR